MATPWAASARDVPREHVAVDEHPACLPLDEAEQRAHQRALAGAVVADDAEHFLRLQLDGDVEQHWLAAVADAQVLGPEHGGSAHAARSPK
jgi:hypothetical protein